MPHAAAHSKQYTRRGGRGDSSLGAGGKKHLGADAPNEEKENRENMKITALIENTASAPEFCCEHGLSLLIETDHHKVLFDSGASIDFTKNAEQLGIDLTKVDVAFLSHGHNDHSGGMEEFLKINSTAKVYAREGFDLPHFSAKGEDISVSKTLAEDERVVRLNRGRTELGRGLTIVSYPTKRPIVETGSYGMFEFKDGKPHLEKFTHEHYLIVSEKGRKTIFTGCSHRGIVNITDWAREDGVTTVVGGFHVMGVEKSEFDKTLYDIAWGLLQYPCRYWTCHCTGKEQYEYMKGIMGDRLNCIASGESVVI